MKEVDRVKPTVLNSTMCNKHPDFREPCHPGDFTYCQKVNQDSQVLRDVFQFECTQQMLQNTCQVKIQSHKTQKSHLTLDIH